MKKSLEFDLPEGCDSISFGRDLMEVGLAFVCAFADVRIWDAGWRTPMAIIEDGVYAYRLKPVAQAEEQDGILVRGIPPLPDGMTECGMGVLAPTDGRPAYYLDTDTNTWQSINLVGRRSDGWVYCWGTTPKPDTVTVEVELPRPVEGKKWKPIEDVPLEDQSYRQKWSRMWVEVSE